MKIYKNQSGFGTVETLLVVVLVGIIGFTGWYVWQANKDVNDSLKNVDNGTHKTTKKASGDKASDPTAGWTAYSSKEGQFSLRYPTSWATATHPEDCSPGMLLLGANTSVVGKCASDGGSHISVYTNDGDRRQYSELNGAYYTDIKTEAVTVDGVDGKRQSGTYQSTEEGIGPSNGDKEVVYVFYTNGKTYVASYKVVLHGTVMPDALQDFDLMVTKTLKFSAQ